MILRRYRPHTRNLEIDFTTMQCVIKYKILVCFTSRQHELCYLNLLITYKPMCPLFHQETLTWLDSIIYRQYIQLFQVGIVRKVSCINGKMIPQDVIKKEKTQSFHMIILMEMEGLIEFTSTCPLFFHSLEKFLTVTNKTFT